MKKLSVLVIGLLCFSIFQALYAHAPSEPPAVEWSKRYAGATAIDGWPYIVIQTIDGGYAIAGRTQAFGAGSFDFWLIKTDANGNMLWNRTYGGANYEKVLDVIQTNDGGYAIVGDSWSFSGWYDAWMVKTDADGNMEWNKNYGGPGIDTILSIIQTSDGGYLWAGDNSAIGAGGYDFWLVKTDSLGTIQWQKTYGGASDDVALSIIPTSDGGYAVFGSTWSFAARMADFWLVKTDVNGNEQWSKAYDGRGWDDPRKIVQTSDGGYVMFGHTAYGGLGPDVSFWLVKTDVNGNKLWDKTYGGTDDEWGGFNLLLTGDGGYAFVGRTNSFGAGSNDFWLVKTDANGNMQWNQTYGGTGNDVGTSVIQTLDGGYALAGYTNSFSGDGSYEVWLIKLVGAGAPSPISATVDISPSTLNLRSMGKWITAYVELPEGYDVADINVSSIMLNGTIPVDNPTHPSPKIGDFDSDGIPDLMVKFSRASVRSYILSHVNMTELIEERFMTITLTITGELYDGTPFQGSDTIRIIFPMPRWWRLIELY